MIAERYQRRELLGHSRHAETHVAFDVEMGRFIALKRLGDIHDDALSGASRLREGWGLARGLSHPAIVKVDDVFEADDIVYVAMEYVDGGQLRPWIAQLSLPQAGAILEAVLSGLAHVHSHGIVHCDLKPDNVLVTSDGRVKIGDFDLALVTDAEPVDEHPGERVVWSGTPHYMAPEQVTGGGIGPAADLYAVGCMAFEMLT